YCPMFYEAAYNDDGTLKSFEPIEEGIPARVRKQVVKDLDEAPYISKPLVPFMQVTQDRVVLEVQRGCIRGCRFCQAGMIYRPTRTKSLETLKKQASTLLEQSGQDEISLSSLSTSDYPELPGLVNYLIENYGKTKNINISLPSLRIDAFSLDVMSKVQDIKKSSLTFAPEGGSQRMRDVINKGLTEEDILRGATDAFKGGWSKVKLYFMLGQPTETEEDRRAIAQLAEKIAETYYDTVPKEKRIGKCSITISTSFFVPKPFTPFQWATMFDPEDYLEFAHTVNQEVKNSLNHKSIRYNWHEAYVTVLEGLLARGDRRIARTIEAAYRDGSLFDAWTEHWDWDRWVKAMSDTGIEIGFYTKRERGEDELFPWDFIDAGVSKKYLLDEWHKAMRAEVTPNCHVKCNICGAAKFHGGVCFNEEDGDKKSRAGTEVPYIYPVEDCNPVPGIHTPASS
ncbi:MAG: TIGR03960 family B12-binding radical SAM protein, partial [Lachnospiraceae bacterium]|nr:TIGR03960 family B12-binding radical SAM protein [Lachnospiraceae bacterium]